MDLCSRDYGFFYVPSLLTFINPWSRFPAVSEAILNPSDATINDFQADHGPEATRDLLCRMSSIWHERKHFHDILFTPFGHYLFKAAFKASLGATLLFMDRAWRKPDVCLPLHVEDVSNPDVLGRVLNYAEEFQRILSSARFLLEASATLAQLQSLFSEFGTDHKYAVEEHISVAREYSSFLDRLENVGRSLVLSNDAFAPLVHRLLLFQLATSEPSGGARTHDEAFKDVLARLEGMSPRMIEVRLQRAVATAWPIFEENVELTQMDDYKWLDSIQHLSRGFEDVIASCISGVARDFVAKSHAFQNAALEDPTVFLDLRSYSSHCPGRVAPLLYYYSQDDTLSMSTESLDISGDDLVAQAAYPNPTGRGHVYSYRMFPSVASEGTITLNRGLWVGFTKAISATLCLVEEVDWLHPVAQYWLRSGEDYGVRFRRRR